MLRQAADQPRRPRYIAGGQRDAGHAQTAVQGAEEAFVRVRVAGEVVQLERCLTRIGTEAGGYVYSIYAENALEEEVGDPIALLVSRPHLQALQDAAANDDVRPAGHDWADQVRYARLVVVVIRVRIDDYVGASGNRLLEGAPERICQSAVSVVADDVVRAGPVRR
jgi:hypothetical protein